MLGLGLRTGFLGGLPPYLRVGFWLAFLLFGGGGGSRFEVLRGWSGLLAARFNHAWAGPGSAART